MKSIDQSSGLLARSLPGDALLVVVVVCMLSPPPCLESHVVSATEFLY